MGTRVYSTKQEAVWIFLDLLNSIARRGWFSAWPSVDDRNSLLYTSFHIHPDDADRIFDRIQTAIPTYGGRTEWILERYHHNRFVLCPLQVALEARNLGGAAKAAVEVRKNCPMLEREAAADLILLSDFLYEPRR